MLLVLVMVVLELAAARGLVSFLGFHEIIGLSTFATNLLVTLAIAAATDYAIFLIGRYQEARSVGEDGFVLLDHLDGPDVPDELRALPQVRVLRRGRALRPPRNGPGRRSPRRTSPSEGTSRPPTSPRSSTIGAITRATWSPSRRPSR